MLEVCPLCTLLPCARFHSNESANCGLQKSTNQILEIASLPSSYLENAKVLLPGSVYNSLFNGAE
jgi:hypothetical protein